MAEKTIALLGQPNSGKSTLFNGLTGSRQHVGNWPGKTVERKDGFFSHNGITYKIVDLPGTYSLSANSDEEVVTRNYISSGEADLVCILADASQLNRSLFMLADYAGIHVPVVLLLNMMDIAEGQGKKINVAGLQKSLGVPVVPMVAADKKQYQPFFNLLENLEKRASFLNAAKLEQLCRKNIGDEYSAILELLPKQGIEIYSASWLAEKLLEQDKLALSFVQGKTEPGIFEKIKSLISCVKDGNLRTADCKFKWIDTLIQENVTSSKKKTSRSRFDKAATSKRWGKPIAIGMIVLGLICSMLIGMPLMELVGALISGISTPLANWLLSVGVASVIVSLLCNAVLTAVTFALQMACYVFGISLVFGFMEDIGYMARIGKIRIPEEILNKPGRLPDEEFKIMKTHSELGAAIIKDMDFPQDHPLVHTAWEICRWHHERWDGKGYPDGLKGEEIPISAQVVSIVNVYDALTSERCYKKAFDHDTAIQMILDGQCGQFNPILLKCLKELSIQLSKMLNKEMDDNKYSHEIQRLSNEILNDKSLPNQNYSQSVVKVMQEKIDFFKSNSGLNSIDYNTISGQLTILNGKQKILCQRKNPEFDLFKEFGVIEEDVQYIRVLLRQTSVKNKEISVQIKATVENDSQMYKLKLHTLWSPMKKDV